MFFLDPKMTFFPKNIEILKLKTKKDKMMKKSLVIFIHIFNHTSYLVTHVFFDKQHKAILFDIQAHLVQHLEDENL